MIYVLIVTLGINPNLGLVIGNYSTPESCLSAGKAWMHDMERKSPAYSCVRATDVK